VWIYGGVAVFEDKLEANFGVLRLELPPEFPISPYISPLELAGPPSLLVKYI
jgi:hypothetical protein